MIRISGILILAAAVGCSRPSALDRLGAADEAVAREAVQAFVERGEAAVPELRSALSHADPLVRTRARTALGRITGQWGCETDLRWKRSVAEAVNPDRPLLVLHLFGELDQEFC